jgi:hypothetical protein
MMMTFRTLKKIKGSRLQNIDSAIISDILLWLLLLFLAALALYYVFVILPAQRGQQITLQFHDAAAIVEGSPVHMMGLEVGHVNNLQIRDGHVDVSIITEPGIPKIPEGTEFTILFTGLGGSESIEAILPNMPVPNTPMDAGKSTIQGGASTGAYVVSEPVRLKQVLDTNILVVKSLQQGSENITDFFGKKRSVPALQENIRQLRTWSDSSSKTSTQLARNSARLSRQLRTNTYNGLASMEGINRQLSRVARLTDPEQLHGKINQVLSRLGHEQIVCHGDSCHNAGQYPHPFIWDKDSQQHFYKAQVSATSSGKWLNAWELAQGQWLSQIEYANDWLDGHPLIPQLHAAHLKVQWVNRQFPNWNAQVDAFKAKMQ